MAKGVAVGHVRCLCGFEDAEVRMDKNGHEYIYCPDCDGQWFTRGHSGRVAGLRTCMRPIAAAIGNEPPGPAMEVAAPVPPMVSAPPVAGPTPQPAKRRLML